MNRYSVFVCYSHRDKALFERFVKHLNPYVEEGRLTVWTDRELLAGDKWNAEIQRQLEQADAGVVLLSTDLLSSAYVKEEELPRLMTRADAGRARLTWISLGAASSAAPRFDIDGTKRAIGDYQALHAHPPIATLSTAEQEVALEACARTLCDDLLTTPPTPRPERHTLTVALDRDNGGFRRTFTVPDRDPIEVNRASIDLDQLEALALKTDAVSIAECEHGLFGALLGEHAWQPVLSKALGGTRPAGSPIQHALRIRIVTGEPRLAALPWARCCWRGQRLAEVDWTFELAPATKPASLLHRLEAPCPVLMIAATGGDGSSLQLDAHHKGLLQQLDRAWNNPATSPDVRLATTLHEVEIGLRLNPGLVYVYGRARDEGGTLALLLDDGQGRTEALPFDHLAASLTRVRPMLAVLNTDRAPRAPAIAGVDAQLHLRHRTLDLHARQEALRFLYRVLGQGIEPVRAFHDLDSDTVVHGAIRTDYQRFETNLRDTTPKVGRARAMLDRTRARQAVLAAVRELVTGPKRTVTCAVAYGAAGNLVDHFATQLKDTVKDQARELARLSHRHVDLPKTRGAMTTDAIDEALRTSLDLEAGTALEDTFRQMLHRGPRATAVILLDWGCYGPGREHEEPLKSDHLEAWLAYCHQTLDAACPEGGRILSYLAVETDQARHARLHAHLEAQHRLVGDPHFDVVALPALGEVTVNDLLRFMRDEHNTSCPARYVQDTLPERIVDKTGGDFEQTVTLLEEAERDGLWPEHYETLPAVPGAPRRERTPEPFDL